MANWTGTGAKRWWWSSYTSSLRIRAWDELSLSGRSFNLLLFSGGGAANGLNLAAEQDATLMSAGVMSYQFNGAGYPSGGVPLQARSVYHDTTNDRDELRAADIVLQNVYIGTGLGADITDVVLAYASPGPVYQAIARWDLGATYTLSAVSPTVITLTLPATGLVRMTIS